MDDFVNYTITFDYTEEKTYHKILGRLGPDEYRIIKDVTNVDLENGRYSDKQTVVEMNSEACLTFRLGMKNVKIRRARSEEELAAEEEMNNRNKIKVTVYVPDLETKTL